MSDIELQACHIIAPHISKVAVFSSTTSSGRTDLSAAAQLGDAVNAGKFVTIMADGGDVAFFFNNADSGTAVAADTSGATRCWRLKDGVPQAFVLRGYTWMVHIASAACVVRAYVSSAPPAEPVPA